MCPSKDRVHHGLPQTLLMISGVALVMLTPALKKSLANRTNHIRTEFSMVQQFNADSTGNDDSLILFCQICEPFEAFQKGPYA